MLMQRLLCKSGWTEYLCRGDLLSKHQGDFTRVLTSGRWAARYRPTAGAFGSCTSIVQFTPPEVNSRRTVAFGIALSINSLPKPLVFGSVVFGPPRSRHVTLRSG